MAKPRTPNQKKSYAELNKRLKRYVAGVMSIFERHNMEASLLAGLTDYDSADGKPFKFDNYPLIQQAVQKMQVGFINDMNALIYAGTTTEWNNSNIKQNMLADDVLRTYTGKADRDKFSSYYQTNSDQLKAFQERRDNGMNLSKRIWNLSENYKQGLETTISTAIEKGMSAVILSKKVSKYLLDWDLLKKDYKQRFGTATDIHDCEYRSMRLARSEINMAYRTAEQTRWKQMDFIVGKEIKLSGSHPEHDICDILAGKYPKQFEWVGWHPNDMCYEIPVLNTEDEFWNIDSSGSKKTIMDIPMGMRKWIADNEQRIINSIDKRTLPYWLRNNKEIRENTNILIMLGRAQKNGNFIQTTAEEIAKAHNANVTPLNLKSFSSLSRKIATERKELPNEDFNKLCKDSARNTIIVDRKELNNVIEDLKKSPCFDRYKEQLPSKMNGYYGHIVNLKMADGTYAEIQVNTPRMIYAKESPNVAKMLIGEDTWNNIYKETGIDGGLGHKIYEEMRVLDRTSEKYELLKKKSIEYYSHFNN